MTSIILSTYYVSTRIRFSALNRKNYSCLQKINIFSPSGRSPKTCSPRLVWKFCSTKSWTTGLFSVSCFAVPTVWSSLSGSKVTIRMLGDRMEKGLKKRGQRECTCCLLKRLVHLLFVCYWSELSVWRYLGEGEDATCSPHPWKPLCS